MLNFLTISRVVVCAERPRPGLCCQVSFIKNRDRTTMHHHCIKCGVRACAVVARYSWSPTEVADLFRDLSLSVREQSFSFENMLSILIFITVLAKKISRRVAVAVDIK